VRRDDHVVEVGLAAQGCEEGVSIGEAVLLDEGPARHHSTPRELLWAAKRLLDRTGLLAWMVFLRHHLYQHRSCFERCE